MYILNTLDSISVSYAKDATSIKIPVLVGNNRYGVK